MSKGNYINFVEFTKHIEKFHIANKENHKMNELVKQTEQWFHDKGLADGTPAIQMLKLFEEFGELAKALDENVPAMVIDALGDMQVVLIGIHVQFKYKVYVPKIDAETIVEESGKQHLLIYIKQIGELAEGIAKEQTYKIIESLNNLQVTMVFLHAQLGYKPLATLKVAYDEIKDRTGEVRNGNFVKTEDL